MGQQLIQPFLSVLRLLRLILRAENRLQNVSVYLIVIYD